MVKGQSLINGERHNIINYTLWSNFKKLYPNVNIDFNTFKEIILVSTEHIKQEICNNVSGFKLPEHLGYLAVSKYKSNSYKVDYKKSKELGVKVFFTNLHSKGYDARIKLFTKDSSICANIEEYKFIPDRKMQHLKSDLLKKGKNYEEFTNTSFSTKKIKLNLDKILYGKV